MRTVRDAAIQMIARKVPKIDAPEIRTGRSRTSTPKYAIFRQFNVSQEGMRGEIYRR